MNWLKILQIIETLAAVLAQLLAKPGVAAPAAASDALNVASADTSEYAASVTATLATLTTLAGTHLGPGVAPVGPPATQAKVEAHEPYLKPLTGL
jgi:hypothetical protein